MAERGILFSGEMVRAILDGRKTQTRRVVKPQPARSCWYEMNGAGNAALHFGPPVVAGMAFSCVPPTPRSKDHRLPCPFGVRGDKLWLRETWAAAYRSQSYEYHDVSYFDWRESEHGPLEKDARNLALFYRADARTEDDLPAEFSMPHGSEIRWRPSIHMPRWASRLTLGVESVRVERLQDITEEDARAEGVASPDADRPPCPKCSGAGPFSCACRGTGHLLDRAVCPTCFGERVHPALGAGLGVTEVNCTECDTYRKRFRNLWREINGPESWERDDFVWVVGFRVEEVKHAH